MMMKLCLPHAIAMGIARAQHKAGPKDNGLRKQYASMHKND